MKRVSVLAMTSREPSPPPLYPRPTPLRTYLFWTAAAALALGALWWFG